MRMHQSGSFAFFTDYDEMSETGAIELLQHVVYQLAALRSELSVAAIPPGPFFVYEHGPELFCGRRGSGPLRVALDTNLLIDYFEFGRAMWAGDSMLTFANGEYGEELEALQIVLAVWVLRDVRFEVLHGSIPDAKHKLSSERIRDRRRAFLAFREAIELIDDRRGTDTSDAPIVVPRSVRECLLEEVPAGADRGLVREALENDAHVFLTRDKRVRARKLDFSPLGLQIASPGELLELLCASGALHCLIHPLPCAYWPLPDLGRARSLWEALSTSESP
jgi:hypothetical protein